MSKAFTKDDVPEAAPILRRRAPLSEDTPNYVTSRGLQALRDELAKLDAAPPSAERDDARVTWRNELEHRITTALVPPPPEDPGEVRFGAVVRIQDSDGSPRELQIVGVDEADAAHDLVAFTSPLARALLGHRAGDVVSVRTPGGDEELTIVAIRGR